MFSQLEEESHIAGERSVFPIILLPIQLGFDFKSLGPEPIFFSLLRKFISN